MLINILKKTKQIFMLMLRFIFTARVKLQCGTYQEPLYVNLNSSVSKTTHLGKNVNFNGMTIHGGGKVVIGDNFHSGQACLMITQFHDYDNGDSIPYGETYIIKNIIIEDNVWLGDRVILLGGVTIGEGAIIQAGSVVVKDIPKYAIAGGHPAVAFKQRNVQHYETLKKEGKFH
ncbi:MAG: acyltransferase [Chloroflexota bacterium]